MPYPAPTDHIINTEPAPGTEPHCQCTTIRPRAIAWPGGEEPIHNPREGGCGEPIEPARAARIEAARGAEQECPAREAEPGAGASAGKAPEAEPTGASAPGTTFRARATLGPEGNLSVTLGSETFTGPAGPAALWRALLANTERAEDRQRARRAAIAEERRKEREHIERAIAEGKRSTGPAKRKDTTARTGGRKSTAGPSISLEDLGL